MNEMVVKENKAPAPMERRSKYQLIDVYVRDMDGCARM